MKTAIPAGMLLVVLAGCATERKVQPTSGERISAICIEENTLVAQAGFLPELRRQIETRGVETSVYSGARPADCEKHMKYTANWSWDLALYLSYAQLNVYDDTKAIGSATYEASPWALDKFGPTATKLTPMVAQLFP